eukprot:942817-Amphidinium_carterae.2
MEYKGPMVFDEYWNRMIGLWKRKNEARREHARMIADMKGVPLEFGAFGEMPYYKRVPESHRVRRFQLGKLKIMSRDCEEEQEANRRRAVAEQEAIEQALLDADNASRHITAAALSQLEGAESKPARVSKGAPTIHGGGSPKRMDEVDEFSLDTPALEAHAAQIAANQAADGSATTPSEGLSSSAAIATALQRRAHLVIPLKSAAAPMTSVPEESAHASDAESYRSATEAPDKEQSEPPADE